MDILTSATIFTGESYIEVEQYGAGFTDEYDRPLLGANCADASDRTALAIENACRKARRADEFETQPAEHPFGYAAAALFS